jgi:pantoate--beta-alanine ligase
MHVFQTIADLQHYLMPTRPSGRSIGLVPTMGALHAGHLDLVAQARAQTDVVVVSIFVNPAQFNNPDDLARYPRTLDADCALLEPAGCDVVFAPIVSEMYPEPPALRLNFGDLETVMEGAFRPGHFNGVGLVVAKLFNIVQPDRAFFGQKDLQQVAVVRRLIGDLSFPVALVRCDTVREADGLAMSSRNVRLLPAERAQAPALFAMLTLARTQLLAGHPVADVKRAALAFLAQQSGGVHFQAEYVEIAHADTLMPVIEKQGPGQTAICVAAQLGSVRLIDNIVF